MIHLYQYLQQHLTHPEPNEKPVWVRLTDESSGLPYFWCKADGETRWDVPADSIIVDSTQIGIDEGSSSEGDFSIRPLTSQDFAYIDSYWRSYGLDAMLPPSLYLEHELGCLFALGAVQPHGQLLGFLIGRRLQAHNQDVSIVVSLGIYDSWRHRGLGAQLVNHFMSSGLVSNYVCVTIRNNQPQDFWLNCGFDVATNSDDSDLVESMNKYACVVLKRSK